MAEKKVPNENVYLKNIIENYKNWEKELVTQLVYEWKSHDPTIVGNREEVWKSLFERIIPKKFHIARSVFIIDSKGNRSREVDLAIYDEQYTPYIFNHGVLKFIPIEAVAAVIECKSSKPKNVSKWLKSFRRLKTSQESSVRIAGRIHHGNNMNDFMKPIVNTQTETRPIKILCYISEEEEVEKCFKGFDITIIAKKNKGKEKLEIMFDPNDPDAPNKPNDPKNQNLMEWYLKLNHNKKERKKIKKQEIIKKEKIEEEIIKKDTPLYSIAKLKDYFLSNNNNDYAVFDKDNSKVTLLSFIFEFNQLLMLINNPIFFPHRAYVRIFNEFLEGKDTENQE